MFKKLLFRIYEYNVRFIVSLNQKIENKQIRKAILFILLPYLILKWVFSESIEKILMQRRARIEVLKDRNLKFKHDMILIAIAKDEGDYIREWISYYKAVGISKIGLYDNGSSDDLAKKIEDFIREGFVDYISWGGGKSADSRI